MCRNITILRGLEPPATPDEIEAAARQYVRRVGGVQAPSPATAEAFERAVTEATADLLAELPEPASAADHGAAPTPSGSHSRLNNGLSRIGPSMSTAGGRRQTKAPSPNDIVRVSST